ncbi:SREBP regulating gene protein isoform X2 [Cylas formicarius]|uniref:SREBP regulating gene protein isoform X2 n=1 Tax=Cylas formicarius TaxID=197179 RepID=UPI002958C161|nr:SREBP regulating gene protein isoform X2 [Cylas formicarius]
MWYAAFVRFIRRRIILGLILTLSFCYCIFNYLDKNELLESDETVSVKRTQPFIWRTLQQHNTTGETEPNCRNSVQGKVLIADERGFVCPRNEILITGCCNAESENAFQYLCETCKQNNCCAIYEHCISCCLHPNKREVLESILHKATERNSVLFASVTDHFELCLAKCRTNSQSVQHENSYRDPTAKHCYGDLVPDAGAPED